MSDTHVMNVSSRPDLFEGMWVGSLFAPIVVLYVHALIFIGDLIDIAQAFPLLKNANEILGYGFGTLLLAGVQVASQKSKNDFIAGPIEQLNLYTFFFLGMISGGYKLALLFTALYEILEVFGLPAIVKSISRNEQEKAQSLGIKQGRFILFQYVFSPLSTVVSMSIAFSLSIYFFSFDTIASMNMADQIKNLTFFIVIWKACETFLSSFYNRSVPQIGCTGFLYSSAVLFGAYQLSANTKFAWSWYGLLIVGGWSMIIMFIRVSLERARAMAASENIKYVTWR